MTSTLELEWKTKLNACFGAARVSLESIRFLPENLPRFRDERNEERLVSIFQENQCDRLDHQNRIPVTISARALNDILISNNITLSALKTSEPPFLNISPESPLIALHGWHRYESAKRHFHDTDHRWWIVTLYDSEGLPPSIKTQIREDSSTSMPFSDGEIYYYLRKYHQLSDNILFRKWFLRLQTESKKRDYYRLHERIEYKPLCDALDTLIPFPALLSFFRIGNTRRLFRMKCPEEISTAVQCVYNIWSAILEGFETSLLDSASVKYLEGRSPLWSKTDQRFINDLFKERKLFSNFQISSHELLKQRVMAINTIIPSITTVLENTKYLEPPAILIRSLLPPKFEGTIKDQLQQIYSNPNNTPFWQAYRELWLVSLRVFPYLTQFKPLQGMNRDRKIYKGDYRGYIASSAIRLGFSTPQIQNISSAHPPVDTLPPPLTNPPMSTDWHVRWKLRNRCGMPDEASFESVSQYLSIENLYTYQPIIRCANNLSPFAIARDTLHSFFGKSCYNDSPLILSPNLISRLETEMGDVLSPSLPSSPPGDLAPQALIPYSHSAITQHARPPPLALKDSMDDNPSGPLTPFPPATSAPPAALDIDGDVVTWDLEVLRERTAAKCLTDALKAFSDSGQEYGLYWYDNEPLFYYPTLEQIPLISGFQTALDRVYMSYHNTNLKYIKKEEVGDEMRNHRLVICLRGNDVGDLRCDREPEL
ncbi:hypothetical protein BDV12DRAFT_179456 [Aspergillus spectabilis]